MFAIFTLLVSFPSLIGSDFEFVAADIHAAPAARAFFAGVEEMENAGFALAKARGVGGGKKIGCGVSDGEPEVGWGAGLEDGESLELSVSPVERGATGILQQQVVDFGQEGVGGQRAAFDPRHGMAQPFSEGDQVGEERRECGGVPPASQQRFILGRGSDSGGNEPSFQGMNIRKKFFGAVGEDRFGIQEVEDGAIPDEQKSVDPLVRFLTRGAHAPQYMNFQQNRRTPFLHRLSVLCYPND
ncbi:MAG TPA: hypothetical protein VHZ25_00060 [Acidobacteriaceae bacterium]|nr:hypothetical protein [Acidobacteriaceae bacterium]